MLLDEKEADAEAHEGEKEALWRRIQVKNEGSGDEGAGCSLPPSCAASGLGSLVIVFPGFSFLEWVLS